MPTRSLPYVLGKSLRASRDVRAHTGQDNGRPPAEIAQRSEATDQDFQSMTRVPRTTIEQWQILSAIVDHGGFAQAAAALNRSQSSISYAVAQLQERIGLPLLRIEGRRAQLTDAGRTLLDDANPLISELGLLEERATALARGEEARIRLAVDSIFPKDSLFTALRAFRQSHPHTRVDLAETVRQAPDVAFLSDGTDLCIATHTPGDYLSTHLMDVELVAIARCDHALQIAQRRALTMSDLSRHLVVTIQELGPPGVDAEVTRRSRQHWTVNTIDAAIAAVESGLCFGWLPRHMIVNQLLRGDLLPLNLSAGQTRTIPLYLIHADLKRAGPAVRALAGLLRHS